MDPPRGAIETADSTIWVDNGIVMQRMRSVASTAESVAEGFGVFRDLTEGSRLPCLIDARTWQGGNPGAWTTAIERAESLFVAVAMLIAPESAPDVGSFPEAIDRLLIPFQVFTDEAEAVAFLRDHLPSEQPVIEPPDDAIETAGAFIWREDAIVFERSKGVPSTSKTASEAFSAIRDLFGGVPGPVLFDARGWPGADVGAWTTAVADLGSTLTAYAILIDPGSKAGTGPFNLDQLPIPTRAFTDGAEALAFLRGFLPSE